MYKSAMDGRKQRATAIVIGAGLSGLSAGKLLSEAGVDVLILEARDRVGGRLYTPHNPQCGHVDLGGAYVGPTQDRVIRLAKEYQCPFYKVNETEKHVNFRGGNIEKYHSDFWPPMDSIIQRMDFYNFYRTMEEMMKEIPMDAPWNAPHAELWDKMTVKEFYDKTIWTAACRGWADGFVNVNVVSEPYEASLLWLLWYVKGAGGVKRINLTENGGQERKFVDGAQSLPDKMAADLGIGEKVLLSRAVVRIIQREDGATIIDSNGDSFECDYIIMALPPAVQMKITYSPPLPPLRNQLIQRTPMGSIIKTIVYYDKQHWLDHGICGNTVAEVNDPEILAPYTMPDTKPDGTYPAIMGFVTANKARQSSVLSKEQRRDILTKQYVRVFGIPEMGKPVHYEEYNWLEDEWSGGCYTAMLPPGLLTKYGKCMREPFGRIYYAGTETGTVWSGYMEGAVQAGERAAREVLCKLGRIGKDEIWQDEPVNEDFSGKPIVDGFWERNSPSVPGFFRILGLGGIAAATIALTKSKM